MSLRDEFLKVVQEDEDNEERTRLADLDAELRELSDDLRLKIEQEIKENRKEAGLSAYVDNCSMQDLLKLSSYKSIHAVCADREVDMAVEASDCGNYIYVEIDFATPYSKSTHAANFGFLNKPAAPPAPAAASAAPPANDDKEKAPAAEQGTAAPPPATPKPKNGFF